MRKISLLNATATLGPGFVEHPTGDQTYQAVVSGIGALTAQVNIEVSNDGQNFLTLGSITLAGTTVATDGFASNGRWCYVRANLISISGTNAIVNVLMGER